MNELVSKEQLERQAQRIQGASQATGIEQSRAIAEVQAAVTVAQRFPRNEPEAIRKALEACGQMSVAERAFYSFPRGGQSVNGPSIALAVELARCWGNIDYGIMELEREDEAGHTEMLAFAWDLQTNTKSRQTFIVPHRRDTRSGSKALTDMRDIYENNANNGARRLRECIFRVLPAYLKEQAEQRCHQTLQRGESDTPLPERIARTISAFEGVGVSLERLEMRQGKSTNWTPVELANLHVVYQSLKRSETTVDEAFPKGGVGDTAEKVKQLARKPDSEPTPTADTRAPEQDAEPDPTADTKQDDAAQEMSAEAQQTVRDIDEPLEQEGDEQPADKGASDEEHPAMAEVRKIRAKMDKCETIVDLNNLAKAEEADVAAMPEEYAEVVKRDFKMVRQALKERGPK